VVVKPVEQAVDLRPGGGYSLQGEAAELLDVAVQKIIHIAAVTIDRTHRQNACREG
jgi:hypothetical protein